MAARRRRSTASPSGDRPPTGGFIGIIAWIVLGAIAGFITNLLMGGGEGVIATVILGIVGAVVGGFLIGTVLNLADVTGRTRAGLIRRTGRIERPASPRPTGADSA